MIGDAVNDHAKNDVYYLTLGKNEWESPSMYGLYVNCRSLHSQNAPEIISSFHFILILKILTLAYLDRTHLLATQFHPFPPISRQKHAHRVLNGDL